jgi:hypothetical protein
MLKNFENADEVRTFPKGRFEIVHVAGTTIGRAIYDPGWRWSIDIGSALGKELCDVGHLGLVLSGRAAVAFADGQVIEMKAGDIFHIPPGHDSWVIGDEPYASLHLIGAGAYAAQDL